MFDMLKSIMKNLVSKPATRKYPYEKREPFKDSRGMVNINIDDCIFCGICGRRCPSDAINVKKGDKSWEIDPYKCIICGLCAEVCPKKCLMMEANYKSPSYKKEKSKFVQQEKPKPAETENQQQ